MSKLGEGERERREAVSPDREKEIIIALNDLHFKIWKTNGDVIHGDLDQEPLLRALREQQARLVLEILKMGARKRIVVSPGLSSVRLLWIPLRTDAPSPERKDFEIEYLERFDPDARTLLGTPPPLTESELVQDLTGFHVERVLGENLRDGFRVLSANEGIVSLVAQALPGIQSGEITRVGVEKDPKSRGRFFANLADGALRIPVAINDVELKLPQVRDFLPSK